MSEYGRAARFIPSRRSRVVVRCGYPVARALARLRYLVQLRISDDDLARLRSLAEVRCILVANHPAPHDWLCLYLLSAKLRLPLHFMTAHEQFSGAKQFWLPRFGAFSVRRGGWGDLAAVRETMRLLARSPCGVVMFSEGRCSFSSRTLMEFRSGAARIGLRMLERMVASQGFAPDLFLVPVAIRYEFTASLEEALLRGVIRLESRLGVMGAGTLAKRVRDLVSKVVSAVESQYDIAPLPAAEWRSRIAALCERILLHQERATGIVRAPRPGLADRVCNVRQRLSLQGHRVGVTNRAAYEAAYFPTLLALLLDSLNELERGAEPTLAERADLLGTLERILYEEPDPRPSGPRLAVIRVGDTVNLRAMLPDYRADRRGVARRIVAALRAQVAERLSPADTVARPGEPALTGMGRSA